MNYDGDFTVATAIGPKLRTYPFEGDNTSFYTEQSFCQLFANFASTPLNTQDPDDNLSFLVSESALQDMGAGVAQWTRIYSHVPQVRDDYESFAYTFPGWVAAYDSTYHSPWASAGVSILPYFPITPPPTLVDPGRVPRAAVVSSKLRHEFFLVGVHGAFVSASLVPLLQAKRYIYGDTFGAYGGGDVPDRVLWDSGNYTSPTTTEYKALITAGTDIVAEDSILRRWKGNIYERTTRYVKAQ